MSENCRFYVKKMAQRRFRPADSSSVRGQLDELLATVSRCEAMWALESRIERSR